jgi:hypothetical protein
MSPVDLKRLKVQLLQVSAAKADLELKIEERLEDIERIKNAIKTQTDKEAELQQKISDAEKAN